MKKHLIENYEIKNLNSNSKSIAVDLRAKLISALEGSISELDYLKSSLQKILLYLYPLVVHMSNRLR